MLLPLFLDMDELSVSRSGGGVGHLSGEGEGRLRAGHGCDLGDRYVSLLKPPIEPLDNTLRGLLSEVLDLLLCN